MLVTIIPAIGQPRAPPHRYRKIIDVFVYVHTPIHKHTATYTHTMIQTHRDTHTGSYIHT